MKMDRDLLKGPVEALAKQDNIYSVMALFGLIILVLSFLPFYYTHKQELESIKLGGEISSLEKQKKWSGDDLNDINVALTKLEAEKVQFDQEMRNRYETIPVIMVPVGGTIEEPVEAFAKQQRDHARLKWEAVDRDIGQLEERKLKLIESMHEHEVSEDNLNTKKRQKETVDRFVATWTRVRWIGLCAGVTLLLVGFILWYWQVQRPQDKILKSKSKSVS
jgi:hypothetical protein